MPLPALAPNNTARLWFKYTTGNDIDSEQHEVMWRYDQDESSVPEVQEQFLNFLNALGDMYFRVGWRVIAARYSPRGSIVSLPVDLINGMDAFEGVNITETGQVQRQAVQDVFVGRSLASGRRVNFSLYRGLSLTDSTFRYGMPGAVQTALSTASGNFALVAIDETRPSWYTYVNQQYNSYWERQLRS